MGREPKLLVATGRKGVGKSFLTLQYIRNYVKPNLKTGWPGRKALIFDTNHEYSGHPDIKAIGLKDIAKFSAHPKIEIRRVSPFFTNGEEMPPDTKCKVVLHILLNFRNGLLLLEDINNYISDHMPKDVIGTILSQRHKGMDIILHYQSVGRIQAKVWPHINILRMHKTADSVARHWQKFPDKYECLQIAENIVNKKYLDGDNRFNLFVNVDDEKIQGNFSEQDFDFGVEEYLKLNYNTLIQPILNRKSLDGKKEVSSENAIHDIKERITTLYLPK